MSADELLRDELAVAGLSEATVERLISSDVRDFIRSDPKVGTGIRGYL
jgi:hypothetical protein